MACRIPPASHILLFGTCEIVGRNVDMAYMFDAGFLISFFPFPLLFHPGCRAVHLPLSVHGACASHRSVCV